jgi:hypothetical protein
MLIGKTSLVVHSHHMEEIEENFVAFRGNRIIVSLNGPVFPEDDINIPDTSDAKDIILS